MSLHLHYSDLYKQPFLALNTKTVVSLRPSTSNLQYLTSSALAL
jgi:hypothetical protein